MNADPAAQLKLLDLQELDAEADHLRHQIAHLPEDQQLARLTAEQADVGDRVRDQQIVVDDLTLAQKKADQDVEQVKARRERDRGRLEGGQVTDPKALEGLQHELEALERRITVLEDEELEVMEQVEEAQGELGRLQEHAANLGTKVAELTEVRDEKRGGLEVSLLVATGRRDPLLADLPDDLLALYEKLRASHGGVGAALLRARQCGGCMLTLDRAEIERIRVLPPEGVARCEECSRILVRTDESGL